MRSRMALQSGICRVGLKVRRESGAGEVDRKLVVGAVGVDGGVC